jgi:hypothetical protein
MESSKLAPMSTKVTRSFPAPEDDDDDDDDDDDEPAEPAAAAGGAPAGAGEADMARAEQPNAFRRAAGVGSVGPRRRVDQRVRRVSHKLL